MPALFITVAGLAGSAVVPAQGGGPLTADDYAEMHPLYARYAHILDSGDADGWRRRSRATASSATHKATRNSWGCDKLPGGHARHWNSQVMITPTAERANRACSLLLYNTGVRPPSVIAAGIYRDTLLDKTADGWRFKTRAAEIGRPAEGRHEETKTRRGKAARSR